MEERIHEDGVCCSNAVEKLNMIKREALLGESSSEVFASRFDLTKCEKTSTEGLENE